MKEINYTIIIPHKNIPLLLQRCLDSIPRRKDMQIIVVDDNSDADKVNFVNFPGLNDPYVEIIFGKNENGRKGAGYARNLGLKQAKGKWLIFADADDFFNPCFEEALDKYKDDESDIIYFKATSANSETLEQHTRNQHINLPLSEIEQTNNWDIAFKITSPWGKFIKAKLVHDNKLCFQEVQYANDVLFSVSATAFAVKKSISNYEIYCITYRETSLTENYTLDSTLIRFKEAYKVVEFLQKTGKSKWAMDTICILWSRIHNINQKKAFLLLPKVIKTCGCLTTLQVIRETVTYERTWLFRGTRKIKTGLRSLYFNVKSRYISFNYKEIPIVIINFNQLFYLEQMIEFLLNRGFKKIVIIDNNSTYPPLLEYYDRIQSQVTVHRLDTNEGHLVFWKRQDLFEKYINDYYVVTDPDIIFNRNLPKHFLNYFKVLLDHYSWATKVGTALQIDDIPNSFLPKEKVLKWENKFWVTKLMKNVYFADIDTTFALYRKYYKYDSNFFIAIRVSGNFLAKHGGWYLDIKNLTEEQKFYMQTSDSSNSWKMDENGDLIRHNYD